MAILNNANNTGKPMGGGSIRGVPSGRDLLWGGEFEPPNAFLKFEIIQEWTIVHTKWLTSGQMSIIRIEVNREGILWK